jgi:hypothetical protein
MTSSLVAKKRQRKTLSIKRTKRPKAARTGTSSGVNRETEVAQVTDELREALEQLTTTAEILEVIRNSLDDTQPVFDAIVESGARLFPGAAVSIALVENGMVKAAAVAERDPARAELWRQRFPFPLTREYMHSVSILDRKMLDIPNVENAPAEMEVGRKNFLGSGYRAATFMPLMRGETAIGALSVVRVNPGSLSAKQLEALKTYANQAVIAQRTPACTMNCGSARTISPRRWSSRRQPPRCCASFLAPRATLSLCLKPCWRTRSSFAGLSSASCRCVKERRFASLPPTGRRRLSWSSGGGWSRSYDLPRDIIWTV